MATTTLATAESIVAACDAWLLSHLTTGENILEYVVNGRTVKVEGQAAVLKTREAYLAVAQQLRRGGGRRTYAQFP